MIHVSEVKTEAPEMFKTPLQQKVYEVLAKLGISFERVDTDEVVTMEDCIAINERLDMKMVKTLFLCNRQQTDFYLFVTAGDKAFSSKDFSTAMGISRVSFAPVEQMEPMLGTKIGAATIFSSLLESAREVRIVFDEEVLADERYGCSDGTTTGYMKVKTRDITDRLLPYAGRRYERVAL